jgi:hypothetical protein
MAWNILKSYEFIWEELGEVTTEDVFKWMAVLIQTMMTTHHIRTWPVFFPGTLQKGIVMFYAKSTLHLLECSYPQWQSNKVCSYQ